ncbi:RNA polymerase sigma factor [Dyadobacter sp. Leaf189]|uniref:RNA polymerase sigma factor n=1 Tax=Dyadobacter sp. Leaf189 TaxID=1736295 RepID=UPI0006F78B31|nr:sigma-70 family RNA polymerase sigma factor [Dyadobacter sp. Leaf189]KQS27769.1 RNA polymerase subunit sigma-70 [Dyadobacter sp. Leaf189]
MEKQFVDLLNQHRGILFKVCKIYAREPPDRQDLFQEIVLQLWRAFPTFRKQANASTWLYRVAMNTAISTYRKDIRRTSPTPFSHLAFPIPDLLEEPEPPDQVARLYVAIDQLSMVEKALVLLYLEEKSYEEIASILGITRTNVGVKLSRIKTKLESLMKSVKL